MALTSRSAILDLNKVCGGHPATIAIAAKGKSTINRIYHLDRGYEKIEKKLQDLNISNL